MNSENEYQPTFRFKQFAVSDRHCGMKIGTDGVLLGAWAKLPVENGVIADVGAGSGLISLMMAQRYNATNRIYALEIELGALDDLKMNISQSPWTERIEAIGGDFRDFERKVDLIVSNPPFFSNGEHSPESARALARHGEGLSPISLIDFASKHLNSDGRLSMIFPCELLPEVEMRSVLKRLEFRRICHVTTCYGKAPSRILAELSPTAGAIERSELSIYTPERKFSPEYIELTKDFYLNIG